MNKELWKGNEAIAEAAIRAGCNCFFGYPTDREDVIVYKIPCDEIASELGNQKVSNMVMLGAYAVATGAIKIDTLREMVHHMFTGRKAKLVELNLKALEYGAACVQR